MPLDLALFLQLAAACAPRVAPLTLAAVAAAESGLDPNGIHDNTPGAPRLHPASTAEAVTLATRLVEAERRSVDLGLMQVNSRNLGRLGLSVADAFDPCRSLAAGARLLEEGYLAAPSGEPQHALRQALSRYNTGDPARGFANGYVFRVETQAGWIVPRIEPGATTGSGPSQPRPAAPAPATLPGGQARCIRMPVPGRPAAPCPRIRVLQGLTPAQS